MSFENTTNKELLALCIYGEARGESTAGKIAVGSVILERAKRNGWFGKTLKEVVLKPYQFSCFLENDPNYPKLAKIAENFMEAMTTNQVLNDCYGIADGLLSGRIQPNVIATHYETIETHAWWDKSMKLVTIIGGHKFFV
jgi:spore germination cell wall hydrolase CwlJ-like protein